MLALTQQIQIENPEREITRDFLCLQVDYRIKKEEQTDTFALLEVAKTGFEPATLRV